MSWGLSGENMIDEVCDALSLDSEDTNVQTQVLRWLNEGQFDLYRIGEWPELIVADETFTTDASTSYDLTDSGYVGSAFGKVIDRTVRTDNYNLEPRPKSFFNEIDPGNSVSGAPKYFCQYSRTDFRLYPTSSSGDTITFDYVKYPTEIEADTDADDISFEYDRQGMIVDAAVWRGYRKYGIGDADVARKLWEKNASGVFQKSAPVRITPKYIKPSW